MGLNEDEDQDVFLPETGTSGRKMSLKQKLVRSLSRSGGSGSAGSGRFRRTVSTGGMVSGTVPAGGHMGFVPKPAFGTVETYKKLEKLGEGTYATVYKGISAVNGKMVALKEIRLEHEEGTPCTAIREVSLLKGLKHANIVTLHDIIHTKKTLTLVFEYLDRDLKQYMDDCGCYIEMSNVKLFLCQLLRGLKFCHSRKVLHRDLKPQNILINKQGELKLADFGLARAKSIPIKTYSNEVVTLWYRPPDVLLGSVEYSTPIDMWGVGCIFYEMISGRPLFPGSTNDDQIIYIWKILGTPTPEEWPGLADLPDYKPDTWPAYKRHDLAAHVPRLERSGVELLNQLLQYNPKNRASAADSLKHRYFAELGPRVQELRPTQSLIGASKVEFKKSSGISTQGQKRKKDKQRRSSVRF